MTDVRNVWMGQGSRSTDVRASSNSVFGQSRDAIVRTDELLKSSRKRDMNPAQATLGYWDKSLACSKSDQCKIYFEAIIYNVY